MQHLTTNVVFPSKWQIFLHRSELFKTRKFIFSLKEMSMLKFEPRTMNEQRLLLDEHIISPNVASGELKATPIFSSLFCCHGSILVQFL